MGMIKTSFFVLLSTLFIVKRHTAHLSLHLGSFTGMLIIPPITEFQLLKTADLKTALYVNLGKYKYMTCRFMVYYSGVAYVTVIFSFFNKGEGRKGADILSICHVTRIYRVISLAYLLLCLET